MSSALPTTLLAKPPLPHSRGTTPSPLSTTSSKSSSDNLNSVEAAGKLGVSLSSAVRLQGNFAKPISREASEKDFELIHSFYPNLDSHPLDPIHSVQSDTVSDLVAKIGIKKVPTKLNLQQAQRIALNTILQAGQSINSEMIVKIRTQEIFNNVLANNA